MYVHVQMGNNAPRRVCDTILRQQQTTDIHYREGMDDFFRCILDQI